MQIIDKSNYFKGLLLLIKKDNRINEDERELLKKIGKILGFEKRFYENAIREILNNDFITQEPPLFTDIKIATCFIKDGIRLAKLDQIVHAKEIEWLERICVENNLNLNWFKEILDESPEEDCKANIDCLEIESFVAEYQSVK